MKNIKKTWAIQAIVLISFLILALGSETAKESTSENDTQEWQEAEKKAMDSWMGSTKAQLIQQWGPPTKTTDDGQGGEILIYDRTVTFPQIPGQVYNQPYNPNLYYTTPQNRAVTRSRMFYVNKNGIIYHWLCQGREGS